MTFKKGDRVKLPANPTIGWDEEYGTVIEVQRVNRCLIIVLDDADREDETDPGIREVSFENAELV